MNNIVFGCLLACLAAILSGSFSSFYKIGRVRRSDIDPLIFNFYFTFGMVLICLIIYIIEILLNDEVTFTYLGIIAGFLIIMSYVFAFIAMNIIGIALSNTLWSISGITTSFIIGVCTSTTPSYWSMCIIGIILIIICIIGILFLSDLAMWVKMNILHIQHASNISTNDPNDEQDKLLNSSQTNSTSQINNDETSEESIIVNNEMKYVGISTALLSGLFSGSAGYPANYTNSTNHGIYFMLSFGIGCLILIIPITWIAYYFGYIKTHHNKIQWNLKDCLLPALLSGMTYGLAYTCAISSLLFVSYAVAYTIYGSSFCVAIIWGVFVFKEIRDSVEITIVLLLILIVLIGNVLVTIGLYG